VVSLAWKTIHDAERFEQLVDRRHLFQTSDVRVPPSNRSAAIAYEVLDEYDDLVRTSASRVAFTDSSILDTTSTNRLVCLYSEKVVSNDLNLSSKQNTELK
nr:hypothetical protein [Tanacetum cinerariifolium]